jgi:hypothetical protein
MNSVTISPALQDALSVLPLSDVERDTLERKIDFAVGIVPSATLLMAQELGRLSRKRSTTLAEIFQALQFWAEQHLRSKNEIVVLHAAQGASPLLAGMHSNMGITIVCSSKSRKHALTQAAEFLTAAVFGYYRIPISFAVLTPSEISPAFFDRAVVLIHGSQKNYDALVAGSQKRVD